MARHKLFVLGAPWFEHANQRLHISRRRTFALGIYLAVTAQPHNRDELAALFWPEADTGSGRANLRRTLYDLDRTLGDEFIVTTDDLVYLAEPENLWIDLAQFHAYLTACQQHKLDGGELCPACVPRLTLAVDLYRGDFLAGFSLRDSPGFDSWQRLQEEQIRTEVDLTLDRLTRTAIEQERYGQAILYAERRVALDPLCEPAHRQLMQLFAWLEYRAAVRRQFELCAHLLVQELGMPPTRETVELYKAALDGRLPRPT